MKTELISEVLTSANLTDREKAIVDSIAAGVKIAQLAREYKCTPGRMRSIRTQAFRKLRKAVMAAELREKFVG